MNSIFELSESLKPFLPLSISVAVGDLLGLWDFELSVQVGA